MTSELASELAHPALSFTGVSVVREGRPILDAIDWEVGVKDRWVVLGPNGSGKTTLLQVAGARLMPSRGTVTVVGEQFGRSDLREVRARVSLVSAATVRSLRPFLSTREVVVTGKDAALYPLGHRYSPADWAAADRILERVMGPEAAGSLSGAAFGVLSEGERQQVLIARSLMSAAELILLDEPASGLDLAARERLVARMGALACEPGVPAVVLVTHHLEEVPPGFTHGLLLAAGRVLAAGRLEDVLTGPLVSSCFGVRVHVEQRDGRWWAHAKS
ncbi:MAG: ABC transporter ATP-binding protein [Acidimicrobiales bacterium]